VKVVLACMLAIVLFVPQVSAEWANATTNIINYWNMSDNGNDWANTTDLNTTGTPTYVSTEFGKALLSNGSNYLTKTGTTLPYKFGNASFSYGACFYPQVTWASEGGPIGVNDGTNAMFFLYAQNAPKGDCATYYNGGRNVATSTTNITPNTTWYCITCVLDRPNGRQYLYLNGTMEANISINSLPIYHPGSTVYLHIGKADQWRPSFAGKTRYAFVYNRTLTSSEIMDMYTNFTKNNSFPYGVYAAPTANVTYIHNTNITNVTSDVTSHIGINVTFSVNMNLTGIVTQNMSATGNTTCFLKNSSGGLVSSDPDLVGNFTNCTFARTQVLAGQSYSLYVRETTGDLSVGFREPVTFPLVTPYYNITSQYIGPSVLYSITGIIYEVLLGASPPDTPTWVAPTPGDGVTNNTQVTINASSASPGVRYYVWFDNTTNPTTLVVNNATSGVYTTNVTSTTRTYYYKAGVWNSTGNFSSNTSVRNWTFDTVNPSIVLNPLNEFGTSNYTTRDPYNGVVSLNITFTDDHDLYGMSVNITRSGTTYFNVSNETLNGLSYNYTNTLNASTWPVGRYNVELFVSDSHTANAITNYQVTSKKSSITFKPGNDNNIKIESRETSTITAVKELDRYSFRIVFDDSATKARVFDVKTDKCPLKYKPNSGFKAHFVSSCGRGGNWVDFEGAEGTPAVTRIDDYHYTVSYASLPSDVTFRSIGGLNVLSVNYSFYVGNYSVGSTTPVFAQEPGTVLLNVTNDASVSNITAVLSYNGTSPTITRSNTTGLFQFNTLVISPNATTNLTYTWTVTATQGDGNYSVFNVSGVQFVRNWGPTSCGTRFANWTQYDEDSPATKLNGTLSLEVTYWIVNYSNARTFNTTFTASTDFSLCFTPVDAAFRADIYAQNTVPDSFTHRFYVQNTSLSNVTTVYPLYNANSSNDAQYSDMRITTRFVANYSYFRNVLAHLQRRYVGEGVWRTVQYDKSGDFGLVFFDIREQTTDYRIRYYDASNNLLLETDSVKFSCTSTVCDLTQLLNPAAVVVASGDVETIVAFNNTTSVLSVSWDAGSASKSVDIVVSKQNFNGKVTVCSITQVGVAGSYDCNATGYTGELFVTIDADGVQKAAEYVPIARANLATLLSKGTQAVITFLLMLTIVSFGMFSPIALVIMTVLSLIVVFFLGTLNALTITFIVIAAVMGFVIAIKVKQ
jgi:hypothetical protein